MWILDLQLPLDGTSSVPRGAKSMILKPNMTYRLGRSAECEISVNLKKVSRLQTDIFIDENGDLRLKNVGHATWVYDNGKKEFKGGSGDSIILNKDTNFKLRSSDWEFDVFKLPDLKISHKLKQDRSAVNFLNYFETSDELTSIDMVMIDGIGKHIDELQPWIDRLENAEWETKGGLARYIVPQLKREKVIVVLDTDDDQKYLKNSDDVQEEAVIPDIETVDVKPFSSQFTLTNRSSKRSRKSQLEKLFDEFDDLDDLDSYTSQNTEKKSIDDKTQPVDVPSIEPLHIEEVNDNLSKMSFKRSLSPLENEIPVAKKIKSIMPERINPNFQASSTGDRLTEAFKKAKQIKMNQIDKDEKLVQLVQGENTPNMVKIKKFQVDVHKGDNPKVYSNYRMSYGIDPNWENRLNYSKFVKVTDGTDYNPIMDSTIKTIKFKNSGYKSNKLQINLQQHDDMIPELDNMFGDVKNNNINRTISNPPIQSSSKKRKRESTTLFVDSEEEETQIHAGESFNEPSICSTNSSKVRDFLDMNIDALEKRNISNNSGQKRDNFYFGSYQMDFNNNNNNDNNNNDDDEDVPVFKSRRR